MSTDFLPNENLTAEESFWVMYYFREGHYELSNGQFDVSDILSASQPFEFDDKGHFDGKVIGNRRAATADGAMIDFWNEAIIKFRKQGQPSLTPLNK